MQTQIDFMIEQAEQNKEVGMNASYEHAKRVHDLWHLDAFGLLIDFLKQNGANPFMAEDVRLYANLRGLAKAPSDTAWGAVMKKAKKSELIEAIGWGLTKNPLAHRTPATLWKSFK
jgi:hypothetical protein